MVQNNKGKKMTHVSPLNGRMLLTALMFVFVCRLSMAARAADVIDHDKVRGFPDSNSAFLKTFQPYLKVIEGCVPFPAVDAAGNVSGGLEPSGMENGDCSRNLGQIYVRAGEYNGQCGVMYSWFFPKEHNLGWPYIGGSRYDWQDVVVWLTSCDSEAQVESVSYSSNGRYYVSTQPHMHGTHPLVKYHREVTGYHFSLTDTRIRGGMQPAVSWSELTEEARKALHTYDFGMGVPFNTYNFLGNLAKSYSRFRYR